MVRLLLGYILLFVNWSGFAQNLKLEAVRAFIGSQHGVRQVVFAPNGKSFASGGTRGEVLIWNVDGDGTSKKMEGHFGSVSDMNYSESGKYLLTAGEDGFIKLWNTSTGLCEQKIVSPKGENQATNKVSFALIAEQNGMIYFGGSNQFLCSVAVGSKNDPQVIFADSRETVRCGVLSPDGKEIIFAVGTYLMALNLSSGEVVREYNTGSCTINALKYSADGKLLLAWCENSRVDMRDPSNFYLKTSFRSGTGDRKFSNVAITEDGNKVVTVDYASRFNMWDLQNSKRVLDQSADQGTILAFDLQSSGNYLLSASLDKSIKLWKIVEDIPVEEKKKPKVVEPVEEVAPEIEVIKYDEPVQDVPQIEESPLPVNTKVSLSENRSPVDTMVPSIGDPIVSVLPEVKNNRRIKPIRKEHKLTLLSHQLTFEIWDAQVIDGDIVSIFIDDECIVKEYSITSDKKVIHYDASKFQRCYLYLHAHNLGTIPPNTVTMTISDGKQTIQVELRSDLSGSSAVELTFEDFVEPE